MDGKIKKERKKHPREGANPLSILTFAFTLPIFWNGSRKDLEVSDLYRPLKEHKSSYLGTKISKTWQKEYKAYEKQKLLNEKKGKYNQKKLKEPSLLKVLFKCFGFQLLIYGIFLAVADIVLRYIII